MAYAVIHRNPVLLKFVLSFTANFYNLYVQCGNSVIIRPFIILICIIHVYMYWRNAITLTLSNLSGLHVHILSCLYVNYTLDVCVHSGAFSGLRFCPSQDALRSDWLVVLEGKDIKGS